MCKTRGGIHSNVDDKLIKRSSWNTQCCFLSSYPQIPTAENRMSLKRFRETYESTVQPGERCQDVPAISLFGRVVSKPRVSGKKMCFYHIQGEPDFAVKTQEEPLLRSVQVLGEADYFESNFAEAHQSVKKGDIVCVQGFPGKTKRGELSIVPRNITVLAPCLQDVPSGRGDGKYSLKDKSTRYRNRHVDFLASKCNNLRPFLIRQRAIRHLRQSLEDLDFIEVETPIISSSAGGALARPFVTKSNVTGKTPLSLRIAPELYLKRLVIGGLDRVFEIGKVFRNEGVDTTHNPEFTVCEFYMAYATYQDLMSMTEELLAGMAISALGTTRVSDNLDFAGPYPRIEIIPALEKELGLEQGTFPDINDKNAVQAVHEQLSELVQKCGAAKENSNEETQKGGERFSVAHNVKLVDDLIGHLLEPKCVGPTFLCNHPIAMSPLAKEHDTKPGISQRFELFVQGKELANAYTELNDPEEQLRRFELQAQGARDIGKAPDRDVDIMPTDLEYCKALEYGLPPTAGWGMGLDRVAMIFAKCDSIRDVIYFPMLAPSE